MSVTTTSAAGRTSRPADRPTPAASVGQQLLTKAQSSRSVIQDFVPLAESLEWQLGKEYLRERGTKAFLSDFSPVPYVINNDGTLSRNAAELFFASLVEAENGGELEPEIFVLELGIGVGLFARLWLDAFQELCRKHRKDFYDRLCYIAADNSPRMLMDAARHGLLAAHGGHYVFRQVDAMEPGKWLVGDVLFAGGEWRVESGAPGADRSALHSPRSTLFRAVFLNYLLDCLPAAVLEIGDRRQEAGDGEQGVKQLCVRTCLARNVNLADFTDMSLEQLQDRAKLGDAKSRRELLEVYGLFASEYDYRAVDYKKLPYGEFGYEYARRWTKRLLLSYGAMQCLDRLLDLVCDGGFILINDYGQTQMSRDDEFEHQRFSLATFVGLNFPLLKSYFERVGQTGEGTGDSAPCPLTPVPFVWLEPAGESEGIHSRLLGRRLGAETRERFSTLFGKAAREKLEDPLKKARECAKVGRFELAASYYNQALEMQPRNWVLLNEISMFLTFSMRDPKAGIDMAKVALALNPTCSAELWSTLGDGLFEFGRYPEARQAYLRALQVNQSDVRARYNLSWVYEREKNYPAALEVIAQALALDKTGEYRERLVQKQSQILNMLSMRNQQEYLLLINLVSRYAKKDEQRSPRPGATLWTVCFLNEGQSNMADEKPTNGVQKVPGDRPVSALSGLVSILIPCCGQLEYTKLCVPSLLKYSRAPFELIFIDIGSLDGTAEYLAGIKAAAQVHVEIVRADTDLNIPEKVKEALTRAKGEYLVLLNNDTVVTHAWLTQLINLVAHRVDIGMVGPMSNYAAPPQLVEKVPYRGARGERRGARGSIADEDGAREMIRAIDAFARQWREDHKGKWIEVERLGGFCILLKREVLNKIGFELDKWTDLGLFDTDILSTKARQAGYTLACCRDLFIHHFGTRIFAHGAPTTTTASNTPT